MKSPFIDPLFAEMDNAFRRGVSWDVRAVMAKAIDEIEHLRASQFRWIPLCDGLPDPKQGDIYGRVLYRQFNGSVDVYLSEKPPVSAKYWCPIPPLPEKSQEEKDEELWRSYEGSGYSDIEKLAKHAFLAGLKAAREQK